MSFEILCVLVERKPSSCSVSDRNASPTASLQPGAAPTRLSALLTRSCSVYQLRQPSSQQSISRLPRLRSAMILANVRSGPDHLDNMTGWQSMWSRGCNSRVGCRCLKSWQIKVLSLPCSSTCTRNMRFGKDHSTHNPSSCQQAPHRHRQCLSTVHAISCNVATQLTRALLLIYGRVVRAELYSLILLRCPKWKQRGNLIAWSTTAPT